MHLQSRVLSNAGLRGYLQFNKHTHTHTQDPGFVPSARLMVGASPRALWLVEDFSCDCMFWDERGGGLTPMGR